MKIIVSTQEQKDILLKESEYIHDTIFECNGEIYGLDSDKAGVLMHIYMNPDMIIIQEK